MFYALTLPVLRPRH